jgi:hypothetical protein
MPSFFVLKEKVDVLSFRLFNFVSDGVFLLRKKTRSLLANNKLYLNKHLGERCFILGTGPSLAKISKDQVLALSNEIVFAVNSIYKAPTVSTITPSYYTLLDNNYWGVSNNTFQEIFERYRQKPPVFITDVRAKQHIPDGIDRVFVYAKNYPVSRMRYDLSGNLSITMNVVSSSILAAIYMGFKEIYLLGCDYNLFCSRIDTHCYDDEEEIKELPTYNLAFYLKYYHLTTEFHYAIAALARQNGIKIINLTDGSLLDAYPAIAAEKILKVT